MRPWGKDTQLQSSELPVKCSPESMETTYFYPWFEITIWWFSTAFSKFPCIFFSASDTVHGIYDFSSNRTKVVGSALHVSHVEQRAALHLHFIYLFLSGHHLAARGHICFWSENLSCCSLCLVGCRKHPREIQWQWFPHDWEDTDCILLPLETHQPEWIGAIFSCDFIGWYLLRESRLYFQELKATRNKLKKPGSASACFQMSD